MPGRWYAAGDYVYNQENQVVAQCFKRDGQSAHDIAQAIATYHWAIPLDTLTGILDNLLLLLRRSPHDLPTDFRVTHTGQVYALFQDGEEVLLNTP